MNDCDCVRQEMGPGPHVPGCPARRTTPAERAKMSRHPEDARLTRDETVAKEEMMDGKPIQVFKTTQEGHNHDVCPKCREELCGGLIKFTMKGPLHINGPDQPAVEMPQEGWPDEYVAQAYGDGKCYSRLIGIELPYDDPNHYDGVSYWNCPDCGFTWDRFTGEERA